MPDLEPPTKGYSLWLEPEADEAGSFQNMLAGLRIRYELSPSLFAPFHVTLLGLPDHHPDAVPDLKSKVEALADALQPFNIEFVGIGARNMYLQSLFLMAVPSDRLMRANALARKMFDRRNDPPYMPHGSLMYGRHKSSLKNEIIARHGFVAPRAMHVTSVSLYDAHGHPNDWKRVTRVQLGT